MMKQAKVQGATAQVLAEMLGRLTPGEKKEFARLVDLDELVQLKADISQERRIGPESVRGDNTKWSQPRIAR